MVEEIKKNCQDIDYCFDSTGSKSLLSAMKDILKNTATACGVGGGHLDRFNWQTTDEGFSIPQEMIPQLIDWHLKGEFQIEKLLQFYPFDNKNQAMSDIKNGKVIKPVLVMQDEWEIK